MINDDDNSEYQVPTWLLDTSPRHPFLIFHEDVEAQPWL